MIRRVDSKDVDRQKFSALQARHASDVFCQSSYFEPLCPQWCLLVLNDYEGALVVPYNKFGPWSWVVSPLFYRTSAWLGTWAAADKMDAIELLKRHFSFGSLLLSDAPSDTEAKIYQVLDASSFSINECNTLAKRMIRKAEQQPIQYTSELDAKRFTEFLWGELGAKVDDMDSKAKTLFYGLITSLSDAGLLRFEGAVVGGVLVGGILVVESPKRHLYLKGTATREAKQLGVYYALMNRAIMRAKESQCKFDFGGSSIQGVAKFNRNFGAQDEQYERLTWGKEPFALRMIKQVRKIWK